MLFQFASRIPPFEDGTPSSLQLALQTCAAIRAAQKANSPSAPSQPVAVPNPRGAPTVSAASAAGPTPGISELPASSSISHNVVETVAPLGGAEPNPNRDVLLRDDEWERTDTFQMLSPFSPEVALHLQQRQLPAPLQSSTGPQIALHATQSDARRRAPADATGVLHPQQQVVVDREALRGNETKRDDPNNSDGGGGVSVSFKTQLLPSMLVAESVSGRYALDDDDASLAEDDWLVGGDHHHHRTRYPQHHHQGTHTAIQSHSQACGPQGMDTERQGTHRTLDRSAAFGEGDTSTASSSNLLLPAGATTILRTDAGRSQIATTLLGVSTVVSDLDESTEPVTLGDASEKLTLSHHLHNREYDDLSVSRYNADHAATLRPTAIVRGVTRMPTITAMARDGAVLLSPSGIAAGEMSLSPAVVQPTPAAGGAAPALSPRSRLPTQDDDREFGQGGKQIDPRTHRSVATDTGTAVLWPMKTSKQAPMSNPPVTTTPRAGGALAPVVDRIRSRIDEEVAKVTVRDAALHLVSSAPTNDATQPSQGYSREELALQLYSLKQQVVLLSQLVLQSCAAAAGPPPLGSFSPGGGAAAVLQSHSSYDFSATSAPKPRRSGGGGSGVGGRAAAAGSASAPIHVRVVRDYDPPVIPYSRSQAASALRTASGLPHAGSTSKPPGGRSSSPMLLGASTHYSSDWTGASKSRVHSSIMTEDSVAVMSSLSSFADSR